MKKTMKKFIYHLGMSLNNNLVPEKVMFTHAS